MKKIYLLLIIFVLAISCSNKTESTQNADLNTAADTNNTASETQMPANTQTFEGDFVYYADSANFSNYTEMKTYPVAMEGEYLNLEREYTGFNFTEPTKVNLKVEGYLEERPGMEEGTTNMFLIVTKIIGFDTNKTSPLFQE